mmetsp:Transcript_26398/g.91812  ORF Transcript_26398/g.91812 Transcript_26398/m.91812 type:complete len:201 (+) Transcript_26398:105-707(+)
MVDRCAHCAQLLLWEPVYPRVYPQDHGTGPGPVLCEQLEPIRFRRCASHDHGLGLLGLGQRDRYRLYAAENRARGAHLPPRQDVKATAYDLHDADAVTPRPWQRRHAPAYAVLHVRNRRPISLLACAARRLHQRARQLRGLLALVPAALPHVDWRELERRHARLRASNRHMDRRGVLHHVCARGAVCDAQPVRCRYPREL